MAGWRDAVSDEAQDDLDELTEAAVDFALRQLDANAGFVPFALAVGAVAERGRMLPCVVFMFVWSTVVYDPIACWTWNANGWAAKMGGLDFAGGTPVHIASGQSDSRLIAFCFLAD